MNYTPRAKAFLTYWQHYRDIDEIQAAARRYALKDGRDTICLNDVEAAWSFLVGPLWID